MRNPITVQLVPTGYRTKKRVKEGDYQKKGHMGVG
jgi:hypothetical protein